MNARRAALLACALLAASPAQGHANEAANPPPTTPADNPIPAWITALSDERFAEREKASQKLWEAGSSAAPALRQAAAGSDPEAAHRAREILRRIDLFITPQTDPRIVRLVQRYPAAAANERLNVLLELRKLRAYRQILKLFASEKSTKVREQTAPMVRGLTRLAARQCLLANDPNGARELLELAPADSDGLAALAAFHRAHGSLDAELTRTTQSPSKGTPAWRLALLRAAGRIPEARNAAIDAANPAAEAAMACLSGDPLAWLEMTRAASSGPAQWYATEAITRWNHPEPWQIPAPKPPNPSPNPDTDAALTRALFLLGHTTQAATKLASTSPIDAFNLHESAERIPDALKALGLNPDQPDFTTWSTNLLDEFNEDPDDTPLAIAQFLLLASFLESRGLDPEMLAAVDAPLAEIALTDEDAFLALLSQLMGGRFPRIKIPGPLLRLGPKWAGNDDDRWQSLLTKCFGDNDELMPAWEWLATLKPETSRADRLAALCALRGYGPDPADLRSQWLTPAWNAIDSATDPRRQTLLDRLAFLTGPSSDTETALRIHDLRPPRKEITAADGILLIQLSAANRWQDAANLVLRFLGDGNTDVPNRTRPDLHAYAAANLRRAGREDEAKIHDDWVEKLALGETSSYLQIAQGYALAGDSQRATTWLHRAACEASLNPEESDEDTGEPAFSGFFTALEAYTTELLESQRWEEAAATSEVLAAAAVQGFVSNDSPTQLLRIRCQADLARAMTLLLTQRQRALHLLTGIHETLRGDGMLADYFFPALRSAGLLAEHDRWFEESWQHLQQAITRHPGSHNTRNTAAWLASRAMRRLDEAETHLHQALAIMPRQAAYLDTMAEVQFVRGNRNAAIEWSRKAILAQPTDPAIRRQAQRFAHAPLPTSP